VSDQKEAFPKDVAAALTTLAATLVVFQYHTLAKFAVLQPGRRYTDLWSFLEIVRKKVALDAVDTGLWMVILLPVFYVLYVELRSRRFTSALAWIFTDDRRTATTLFLTSLVAVRYYFASGALSWVGDAPQHISYLDITSQILSNFELPIWTNYYGTGSPFLQFYGFLYFVIGGLLDLAIRDINLTGKLVLGLSHAVSGIGVYYFCRALLGSRRAAFLAGLGYVLCFWHAQHVIVMGRHPVGLFYALLPWPFVYLERSLGTRRWWNHAVAGGICHAALIFTHPGYGVYATAFLGLYALLRGLELRDLAPAVRGISVAIFGLILSGPHTLPMYTERAATKLSQGFSLAGPAIPTLGHLLNWSNYRFSIFPVDPASQHWYGGYFGLSLLLIGACGIALSICSRTLQGGNRYLAVSGATCIALLLPFTSTSPLLQALPLIPDLAGGRYLLFTAFFVCVSTGMGARLIASPSLGRDRSRRFTILLGLVLLDLGPTTFQQPYVVVSSTSNPELHESRGELKDYRNLFTLRDHSPQSASRSQVVMHTPTARAPHPGDLLAQSHFVEPFEQLLTQALPDTVLAEDWERLRAFIPGMQMLNVKHVYLHRPQIATLDWHSPVLVAGSTVLLPGPEDLTREIESQVTLRERIEAIDNDPSDPGRMLRISALHWTLGQSEVDEETGSLANVVLADGGGPVDLGTNPECEVLEHTVWNTRVHLRVRVTDQCFARLAYAYFPYLDVSVDGRLVEPLVTMGRFMAVQLDAGEHVIEIQATLSPLRKVLWLMDLFLLVGWFGWGRSRVTKKMS
jgi:hypothetical protein